jgi:hypothetical protein
VVIPAGGAEVVRLAQGGVADGCVSFLQDNKLHYLHSYMGLAEFTVTSIEGLSRGYDFGQAVTHRCETPFRFSRTIKQIVTDITTPARAAQRTMTWMVKVSRGSIPFSQGRW